MVEGIIKQIQPHQIMAADCQQSNVLALLISVYILFSLSQPFDQTTEKRSTAKKDNGHIWFYGKWINKHIACMQVYWHDHSVFKYVAW